MGLSIGQLTTWQLASPQKAREKSQREKLRERENNPASGKSQYFISSQKGHPFIFVTLSSLIVSHQAQPTLKGRGSHSMEIPEGGITGSILETAYYRLIFEQRNKWSEGVSYVIVWGKNHPRRRTVRAKPWSERGIAKKPHTTWELELRGKEMWEWGWRGTKWQDHDRHCRPWKELGFYFQYSRSLHYNNLPTWLFSGEDHF